MRHWSGELGKSTSVMNTSKIVAVKLLFAFILVTTSMASNGWCCAEVRLEMLNDYIKMLDFSGSEQELQAMARIKSLGTNALPIVIKQLRARDSKSQLWLRRWLAKVYGGKLQFEPADLRQLRATRALTAIGPEAIPAAVEFLRLDNYVRYTGVRLAIWGIGEPGVPYLLNALTNDDKAIRLEIVRTVGLLRSDGATAVPGLVRVLSDESSTMREAAAIALGQIKSKPDLAVPALAKALNDPTVGVRQASVNALRGFGLEAHTAAPALIAVALNDDDGETRDLARGAIIHVTSSLDQIRAAGNK